MANGTIGLVFAARCEVAGLAVGEYLEAHASTRVEGLYFTPSVYVDVHGLDQRRERGRVGRHFVGRARLPLVRDVGTPGLLGAKQRGDAPVPEWMVCSLGRIWSGTKAVGCLSTLVEESVSIDGFHSV